MPNANLRHQANFVENVTIRAASGDLTTAETTTPITGVGSYKEVVLLMSITTMTTADADDVVDFYIQTSYDAGTTWHDLENLHFDIADTGTTPVRVIRLGPLVGVAVADVAAAPSDGALTDDTKANFPLGGRLRIKTLIEGATAPTYAYSVVGFFSGVL